MVLESISQIISKVLEKSKSTIPKEVLGGKLYTWRGIVTKYLTGNLKFKCLPNFGLVIEDDTGFISCIVSDAARYVPVILKNCNQRVVIVSPEILIEIYLVCGKEYNVIYLYLNGENLRNIDENAVTTNNFAELSDSWYMDIHVLKISPVINSKSVIYCFVLVQLNDGKVLWIVMRNNQTAWKDVIIPNRRYRIHTSVNDVSPDYFQNYISLQEIIKSFSNSFNQMLHHSDLIITQNSLYMPENSKLYLMPSTQFKPFHRIWSSISDKFNFFSTTGVIQKVYFSKAWNGRLCQWCNPKCQSLENKSCDYDCVDPWIEDTHIPEYGIEIPTVKLNVPVGHKYIGFGIRGGTVNAEVTIQDKDKGIPSVIYLKNWREAQYPAGLFSGMVVMFTDLLCVRSKNDNVYYISTPLTRISHLQSSAVRAQKMPRGSFEYPNTMISYNREIWFPMELERLFKVSLCSKCKLCSQQVVHNACCNISCLQRGAEQEELIFSATAWVFVNGLPGTERVSLCIKDELVKRYLGFPNEIWEKLKLASRNKELLYLLRKNDEGEERDLLGQMFCAYCKYFRPKNRFHALCRRMKHENDKYYCTNLEEINEESLEFMHQAVNA